MSAYFILEIHPDIEDQAIDDYLACISPDVAFHGGNVRSCGGKVQAVQGDRQMNRLVIIEFRTASIAREWYDEVKQANEDDARYHSLRACPAVVVAGLDG
ncbi:uncharacterized protein (DUF1330 family) [Rhizobium sp. BK196]|jgi:uncharacterized protein (DUF1330 family)|uniref:DUF1330 domain-containing protein n=1 Tax=unclassified Rhizobium TaxID=2613769 RepID=UPI001614A395|nr:MULTISPECIES: DUF1330 domain-containing protein [unclassified Rhizobium]MBB3308910.1 uncharacterized protein (DUF1330 family) [Rhizobium sp. BK196]MBB3461743.1 uncharacterized protein (DUF1330 family) [Rhizobium sp. BK377]